MRRYARLDTKKIHLFTYFIYSAKQTQGRDFSATPAACCLLELLFKLTGSLCPLLWSFQINACCPPKKLFPHPTKKNKKKNDHVSSRSTLELNETGTSLHWTLDGAIQLGRKQKHRAHLQNVTACFVVHVDVWDRWNIVKIRFVLLKV